MKFAKSNLKKLAESFVSSIEKKNKHRFFGNCLLHQKSSTTSMHPRLGYQGKGFQQNFMTFAKTFYQHKSVDRRLPFHLLK